MKTSKDYPYSLTIWVVSYYPYSNPPKIHIYIYPQIKFLFLYDEISSF